MNSSSLSADRLHMVINGLSLIAAAPLDPDAVAEVAARVSKVVAEASGCAVTLTVSGVKKVTTEGDPRAGGSSLSVPLEAGDRSVGQITVMRKTDREFDESDAEALKLIAPTVAALAVHAREFTEASLESRVDAMTGLGSRLAFEERLSWE